MLARLSKAIGAPLITLVICWLPLRATGAEPEQATSSSSSSHSAESFNKAVRPLFEGHCIECHGGEAPEAKLALDRLIESPAVAKNQKTWKRVLDMLSAGAMPPDESPRPAEEQYAAAIAWIGSQLDAAVRSLPPDPGRVTARRLNRVEYNNTIRDLLGVDFHPADDFPADDVGYGFDNIGDVLSLPPMLMEKYLAAAEKIVQRVIVAETPQPKTRHLEAEQFDIRSGGGKPSGEVYAFFSDGAMATELDFSATGDYVFRIRAFGALAGDEPPKMPLEVDDQELRRFDVEATSDHPRVYEHRARIERGRHRLKLGFVNDYYSPDDPDQNNRDRNLYIDYVEVDGPYNGETPPISEVQRRTIGVRPTGDDWSEAARRVLRPLARRAFRRPVSDAEVDRFAALVNMAHRQGDSFERGIQLALEAILVSPHFLFRIEHDPDPLDARRIHKITPHELATRLSYFLWSSTPDDQLLRLADDGMLRVSDVLEAETRRMLADPKAAALVRNLAGQWLQLRNLDRVSPDPKRFPDFDDRLRQAMRRETELFFADIMREDRSVLNLIDADFTYLNERLAGHYGIAGVEGENFRRVKLDDPNRGGVLTQASVLTITSNPTRTSPVKRGKWVLENLLASPIPPPPPGVPKLDEGAEAVTAASLRQRMQQHRKNPTCASCHAMMDPLGFGLENFDAVGAWRTQDGKFPIDASGVLPDGRSFSGPAELKKILLARRDDFCRCMSEKMLTYALGRGLEPYDHRTVERITRKLAEHEYRFSSLVIAVVQSDPFQMRRGEEPHDE